MRSKTRFRPGWILTLALLTVTPALAQYGDQPDPYDQETRARLEDDPQTSEQEQSKPIFTFNVTPSLLSNAIDLFVEKRLSKDYDFDEYQAEEMRLLLQEEVPKFLSKHQGNLETLVTEWLEAVSADQPPDAEFAAKWATRFRPIVEDAQRTFDNVGENMREFLDDRQQVLLDGYIAAIDTGTNAIKGRLYEFEQGQFDPEIHWLGNKAVRHHSPEEIRILAQDVKRARREAMGEPINQIDQPMETVSSTPRPTRAHGKPAPAERDLPAEQDIELVEDESPAVTEPVPEPARKSPTPTKTRKDEWTLYVEAFIKRYQLNQEQQQKAHLFLQREQANRDRYLIRKGSEMERIERLFKGAKNKKQLETAEKVYQKMQDPLNGMFERLKQKLNTLPTRAQRRNASKPEVNQPERDKPARKSPAGKRRP